MIFKLQYTIDVEIKCDEEKAMKEIVSRTRQKIKRAIFDSPDNIKPTKIKIESK
jgi:hypothetical protein